VVFAGFVGWSGAIFSDLTPVLFGDVVKLRILAFAIPMCWELADIL